MSMILFEDRVSTYPNRYTMTDENGNVHSVVLERADEPIKPGTPLNAETFNAIISDFNKEVNPPEMISAGRYFVEREGWVEEFYNGRAAVMKYDDYDDVGVAYIDLSDFGPVADYNIQATAWCDNAGDIATHLIKCVPITRTTGGKKYLDAVRLFFRVEYFDGSQYDPSNLVVFANIHAVIWKETE